MSILKLLLVVNIYIHWISIGYRGKIGAKIRFLMLNFAHYWSFECWEYDK